MPVPKPCCSYSLEAATKAVAIVNIILSILAFIVFILLLIGILRWEASSKSAQVDNFVLFRTITLMVFCVAYWIMSVLLLLGATQRDYGKCRVWLVVTLVFLVIYILFSLSDLYSIITEDVAPSSPVQLIAGIVIAKIVMGVLITGCEIWIVHAFMEELRPAAHSTATRAEVI